MYVIIVQIHVKPEHREAFIAATRNNAQNTILEPKALRFDVLQTKTDPNHFVLYEAYTDATGIDDHRLTAHFITWRDTVAPWMAVPREKVEYDSLEPVDPARWAAVPKKK